MELVDRLKKIALFLACLSVLAPLVANKYFVFPYIFPKNIFFRLAVLLLFSLVAVIIFLEKKWSWKRGWLLPLFGVFLLTQLLAAVFGVNPENSFFGNFERMDGFFNLFFLGLYFFSLANLLRAKSDWLWLLRFSLLGSLLVTVLSWLFLWPPAQSISWLSLNNSGTIDNTAFFGSYLLINIFIAALLLVWEFKNQTWRWIYAATGLVLLLALLINASRGSILGLLFGLMIGGGIYFFRGGKKFKIIFISSLLLLVVLAGAVWLGKDSAWVQQVRFLKRFADIANSDFSSQNRWLAWQVSWRSFLDRPLLGYGPENGFYGINKYYNPAISEQWFDRSHNFFFDYLNASGLVGLAGYLALFGSATAVAVSLLKKNYWLGLILTSFFAAYLLQNLFIFDTINTWIFLVVLLALTGSLADSYRGHGAVSWPKVLARAGYPLLALAIFVVVGLGYFLVIRPAQANYFGVMGIINENSADHTVALYYYQQGIDMKTIGRNELTIKMALYAINLIQSDQIELATKKAAFTQAEKALLDYLAGDSADIRVRLVLAQLYQSYAALNSFYAAESVRILIDHIQDSPRRLEIYSTIANGYFLEKDFDNSLKYLEQVIAISDTREGDYLNLINVAAQANYPDRAEAYLTLFFNKFPNISSDGFHQLSRFYFNLGQLTKAKELLINRALPQYPDDLSLYVALASLYDYQGDYQAAADVIGSAINRHEEWQATLAEYLAQLKQKITDKK